MGKIRIMIVEDEMVVADHLAVILHKLGYESLPPVINYSEAVSMLESEKPDLALLDIQLAGSKDGIDLAWKIKEEFNIPFIFLTSNADPRTVARAKHLNPPAYLVKPFNRDDLYTSIELALFNFQSSPTKPEDSAKKPVSSLLQNVLFVRNKNLFVKVKIEEIVYLKADHVYVEVHTLDEKVFLIRNSLTQLTDKLPKQFFRVHRSYTVNLDHLEAINSLYILAGSHKIPVGKNYRDDLLSQISIE